MAGDTEWSGVLSREVTPRDSASAAARPDLFISYAREQKAFVQRLAEALSAAGKTAWVDWKDIRPTADWRATVRAGIERATAFVFVLSADSLASEVCDEELLHAAQSHKRIIPILRADVDEERVPPELSRPNWISFADDDQFDPQLQTLVEALESDLGWLEAHARILTRAVEWEAHQGHRSRLLRGRDLAEAKRWLAQEESHREHPTALQREFIEAGRRAARRRWSIGAAVATMVVIIGAVLGLSAREQRQTANSRSLAAAAMAQIADDPWRALEQAVEAERVAHTDEAVAAMREALDAPRESAVLRVPGETLTAAHFTPDSGSVEASAYDVKVWRWNLESGRRTVVRRSALEAGSATDRSPDERLMVLAMGGGVVRGGTDEALREAAPGGGLVRIVQAASSLPLTERPALLERSNLGEGIEGVFPAVEFSPDGRSFLETGYDGTVRVWPLNLGALPARGVRDVAISPDGTRCLTVDGRGTATLSSCREGRRLRSWSIRNAGDAGSPLEAGDVRVRFGDDGTRAFVSTFSLGNGNTTTAWDVARGERLAAAGVRQQEPLAYSGDGRVALIEHPRRAAIVDVATGRPLSELSVKVLRWGAAEFSHDRSRLVTWHRQEPLVRVWEVATGRLITKLGPFRSPVEDVDLNPGDDRAVVATGTRASVWDTAAGKTTRSLRGHSDLVMSAEFSPSGAMIAAAGADGTARVWDAATGRQVAERRADDDAALKASIADNGMLTTVGLSGTAYWFACAACRPEGEMLASAKSAVAGR